MTKKCYVKWFHTAVFSSSSDTDMFNWSDLICQWVKIKTLSIWNHFTDHFLVVVRVYIYLSGCRVTGSIRYASDAVFAALINSSMEQCERSFMFHKPSCCSAPFWEKTKGAIVRKAKWEPRQMDRRRFLPCDWPTWRNGRVYVSCWVQGSCWGPSPSQASITQLLLRVVRWKKCVCRRSQSRVI